MTDKAKDTLHGVTDKAGDVRKTVGGKLEEGIDKVADAVNSATGGRFEGPLEKVKELADKIDGSPEGEAETAEADPDPAG